MAATSQWYRVLDLWRDNLSPGADTAFAEMASSLDDQDSFARAARKLLTAFDLAEAEVEAAPEDNDDAGDEGSDSSGAQDNAGEGEAQSQDSESLFGAQPEQSAGDASEEEGEGEED